MTLEPCEPSLHPWPQGRPCPLALQGAPSAWRIDDPGAAARGGRAYEAHTTAKHGSFRGTPPSEVTAPAEVRRFFRRILASVNINTFLTLLQLLQPHPRKDPPVILSAGHGWLTALEEVEQRVNDVANIDDSIAVRIPIAGGSCGRSPGAHVARGAQDEDSKNDPSDETQRELKQLRH